MKLPVVIAVLLTMLAACAAKEVLIAKSAIVPNGVDFTGQWQLRAISQDTVRQINEAEIAAAGGNEKILVAPAGKPRLSRQRSSGGTLVHVFLETGNSLRITQTEHGIFINFDRSVVEEYRFGENREVNVGPVLADRVSGWDGESYVVETLDEDGAKLIEIYGLFDGGRTMIRTISILHKSASQIDVKQLFDRI